MVLWVWVFLAIAVAGLVTLVCYAVWLAHLTADVLSEVAVLADRGAELLDVVGHLGAPSSHHGDDDPSGNRPT